MPNLPGRATESGGHELPTHEIIEQTERPSITNLDLKGRITAYSQELLEQSQRCAENIQLARPLIEQCKNILVKKIKFVEDVLDNARHIYKNAHPEDPNAKKFTSSYNNQLETLRSEQRFVKKVGTEISVAEAEREPTLFRTYEEIGMAQGLENPPPEVETQLIRHLKEMLERNAEIMTAIKISKREMLSMAERSLQESYGIQHIIDGRLSDGEELSAQEKEIAELQSDIRRLDGESELIRARLLALKELEYGAIQQPRHFGLTEPDEDIDRDLDSAFSASFGE